MRWKKFYRKFKILSPHIGRWLKRYKLKRTCRIKFNAYIGCNRRIKHGK